MVIVQTLKRIVSVFSSLQPPSSSKEALDLINLQKSVITGGLTCIAVSLRQDTAIQQVVRDGSWKALTIKLLEENLQEKQIVESGLLVLKQLLCSLDEDGLSEIETEISIQELKTFLRRVIEAQGADDVEINELALLCLIALETRGQAMKTKEFDEDKILDLF